MPQREHHALVLGGGTMGVGIIAMFIGGGWTVDVVSRSASTRDGLAAATARALAGMGKPTDTSGLKTFATRPEADWSKIGPAGARLPTLPDFAPVIDAADATRPFRLVTAPARQFLNSTFTETPSSQAREKRPTILIHPLDAESLGLAEGDRVQIGNDQATIVVHARYFDGVLPGVVVIESIWPNSAFEGGLGVNALVSAEPGLPNGGAVFHDTAVWLKAA